LTQRISAPPGVLAQISMLEESVRDTQCVVTLELQQEHCGIMHVSITMSANHTLPYPLIVPNVFVEISQVAPATHLGRRMGTAHSASTLGDLKVTERSC